MISESRVFLAYFAQFLKSHMAYRFSFFAGIFSNAINTAAGLVFILFLIDGSQISSIQGWSKPEVLFIYGYSMLSMALFSSVAYNLYQFGDRYIIQGQFDRILLRPLNTLSQVLFESFNLDAIGGAVIGALVVLAAAAELGMHFGLIDWTWFFLSSLSAAIILISVFIVVASVSFHFEDRIGIAPPVYHLITFGRYPTPIFNRLINFILTWLLPFAFVGFYPATHFFEREGFETFCYLTPLVAVLSLVLSWKIWQFGVSKYESTGN